LRTFAIVFMITTMKRTILVLVALLTMCVMRAEKYPEIKFEKTTIDMGTFSMYDSKQTCVFKFTNVGDEKLIINTVHTSCGCTVADYSKEPISPGGTGEIKVTYNGAGKMPGRFKKSIQVFSNCKKDMARVFITGIMTDVPAPEEDKKK